MIGTLVHNCLAYYYAAKLPTVPDWLSKKTMEETLKECTTDQKLIDNAIAVYEAYKIYYTGEPWEPYSVETEYAAKVGEIDPDGLHPELDDEIVTCRSDLVVTVNDEAWIVDYKCTGGEWGKDRLSPWKGDGEYRLSWQAMLNLMILRARLPMPVNGFIIQRVKRKAPFDFDRRTLSFPVPAYESAKRTVREFVRRDVELQRAMERGDKLTANFDNCITRWGNCDYMDICGAESEALQQMIMERQFVQIGGFAK